MSKIQNISEPWAGHSFPEVEAFLKKLLLLASGNFVDLGLPSGTLWATTNIGAASPEEYGKYFQWGDIQGYTADQVGSGAGQKMFADDFSDYKFFDDGNFTKYNDTDQKTTLDAEDDAVKVLLGANFATPTVTQFEELCNTDYVVSAWTSDYKGTGVAGRVFTSVANGNQVFLPAAGFAIGGSFDDVGYGYYWSSVLDGVEHGLSLRFDDGDIGPYYDRPRFFGMPLRPVQNASV